ncbi:MAG: 1-deoxy-D-xylulose-5-phosphate reductoisomerase [Erysipelotrichales bacterium]
MKRVIVLGASGSIGQQTLNVVRDNNGYIIEKISVGYNIKKLIEILEEFSTIKEVALLDEKYLNQLESHYPHISFYIGAKGILHLLDNDNYDIVLNSIIGFAGVLPSLKTIQNNKVLALANKETMVVAGPIVKKMLKEHPQSQIIPVDSEHCAIFQCMQNGRKDDVNRIIITASGGSFRDKSLEELKNVSVQEALNHPNWDMGAMITIDSATMLNKGLEVIEAHYLFGVDYEKIEVVIHKESIVHSMVEYNDSSTIAQLSLPNMEQPIAYALAYPNKAEFFKSSIDFNSALQLNFEPVDYTRFKGLAISYQAGKLGHSYPCVLNAAKEVATRAFLNGEINFLSIVDYVEKALLAHKKVEDPSLKDLVVVDNATRKYTQSLIKKEILNDNN